MIAKVRLFEISFEYLSLIIFPLILS